MRILTLFLALLMTLLPESVPFVSTASYGQEVCLEEVCDVEDEAILRSLQRMLEKVQDTSETVSAGYMPVCIPVLHYRSIHICFERLWLAACTLLL